MRDWRWWLVGLLWAAAGVVADSKVVARALDTPRPLVGQVESHVAVEGEDLLDIAERFDLAIDHLCFANDWPAEATRIYPGTQVVLPQARVLPAHPPRDGLVVNLPERGLFLFSRGRFVKFYAVSIGLSTRCPTPTMQTRVVDKARDPTWYPPRGSGKRAPVPPGADNPLGDRWLGLGVGSYGIHSTNNSVNIGLSTTLGCIRLYPNAMHRLYDQVRVGMSVRVEYETAKVGRNADGALVLVTFPDVYGKSPPAEAARKALVRLGLAQRWNSRIEAEAHKTRGLPIPL